MELESEGTSRMLGSQGHASHLEKLNGTHSSRIPLLAVMLRNDRAQHLYGFVVHQERQIGDDLLNGGAVTGNLFVAEGEKTVLGVVIEDYGVVLFIAVGHKEFYALQGLCSPREIC